MEHVWALGTEASLCFRYAGSNQITDPLLYGKDGFPDDQASLWLPKSKAWSKWNVTTPNIQILYVKIENTESPLLTLAAGVS